MRDRMRLMSLRVSPSSAALSASLNSLRDSWPEPSASALRNTRSMSASSSACGSPCSSIVSTSPRTTASTSAIMARAVSLALMDCSTSTMTGRNSLYCTTSSSFSSASARICLIWRSDSDKFACCSTRANSARSRYPLWSVSASRNSCRMSGSSSAGVSLAMSSVVAVVWTLSSPALVEGAPSAPLDDGASMPLPLASRSPKYCAPNS
mmetsp:Transcript_2135/g.5412  ORF Transcript_2135/g.5412 Transcript_2135/m.5412 type:complete len:208 (-) Transcript_2135:235-858(-)